MSTQQSKQVGEKRNAPEGTSTPPTKLPKVAEVSNETPREPETINSKSSWKDILGYFEQQWRLENKLEEESPYVKALAIIKEQWLDGKFLFEAWRHTIVGGTLYDALTQLGIKPIPAAAITQEIQELKDSLQGALNRHMCLQATFAPSSISPNDAATLLHKKEDNPTTGLLFCEFKKGTLLNSRKLLHAKIFTEIQQTITLYSGRKYAACAPFSENNESLCRMILLEKIGKGLQLQQYALEEFCIASEVRTNYRAKSKSPKQSQKKRSSNEKPWSQGAGMFTISTPKSDNDFTVSGKYAPDGLLVNFKADKPTKFFFEVGMKKSKTTLVLAYGFHVLQELFAHQSQRFSDCSPVIIGVGIEYSRNDQRGSLGRLFAHGFRAVYPQSESEKFQVAKCELFDAEFTKDNFCSLLAGLSNCFQVPDDENLASVYPPQNVNFHSNRVYKYFSGKREGVFHRNFALFLLSQTNLDAQIEWQSENEEAVISYAFVEGTHLPTNSAQILKILEILHSVHSESFVHGDIRLANMVFATSDPCKSRLIDWDYGGVEGLVCYPSGYACDLEDGPRHPDVILAVQQGEQTSATRLHDCYAMAEIMSKFVPVDEGNAKYWNDAINVVRQGELVSEAMLPNFELRTREQHMFRGFSTPETQRKAKGTGSPPKEQPKEK